MNYIKYLFTILLMFSFSFSVFAATASNFTVTNVPEENFYLTETNKLIMDIALPNPADDGAGIECDGSTSTAVGACDAVSTGAVLIAVQSSALTTGGLMCADSITTPAIIFRHATSCATDGTASGVTNYRGTAVINTTYTSISTASQGWAFRDTLTVNSVYDAGEDIYIDGDKSLFYNADKLASITVSNVGTAIDSDLFAIKIYQESGAAGFDPNADTLIGSDNVTPFLGQVITTGSSTVYITGASVTASNRRIYIAVDISNSPAVNNTIQARIAAGAATIAMSQSASTNNGPTDAALTNTNTQAIRKPPERIPPTSSITSPVSGATIEEGKSYTITGLSNDAGGSSVQIAEISFDNGTTYFPVTPKTSLSAGFTWEYVWTNPVVGSYTIKVRAADWLGNREVPRVSVTVTVAVPIISETPVVPVAPEAPVIPIAPEAPVIPESPVVPETPAVPLVPVFVRNLTVGSRGDDVKKLQQFLVDEGFLDLSGCCNDKPTKYFGKLTKAALAEFQKEEGISPAVGYFGPITRFFVNELFSQ